MNLSRKQFVGGIAAAFGGLVLPAHAFGEGVPLLKFGLVSDVHLGGEGKEADLETVLRYFDAEGVDAVMIPGDIAHTGLICEFERFAAIWYKVFPNDRGLDGRKVEKLIVSGNHCIDGWSCRWKGWSEEKLRAERFNYADNPQKTWQRLFRATMNSNDCQYANDARTYEVKDSKLCLHAGPRLDAEGRRAQVRGPAVRL